MTGDVPLIPWPKALQMLPGRFRIGKAGGIVPRKPHARPAAEILSGLLRAATGRNVPLRDEPRPGDLTLDADAVPPPDEAGFHPESFTLEIVPDAVRMRAAAPHGLLRAVQRFLQILSPSVPAGQAPAGADGSWPCLRLEDAPRLRWRGLHVDVARYFFDIRDLHRFVDVMAVFNFNVLHLHLTDDQGWRIEIEAYPRLTEIGGYRACTVIGHDSSRPRRYDETPHGGFYTRRELRGLIEHAARLGIGVMPEIDMPGHVQAAIAAYPELGNTDMTIHTRCHWGVSQHILNPRPETVAFMQTILNEVMDVFPSRFIHIGGDEALKHEWTESRYAQDRMRELKLRSEAELQSWFLQQMCETVRGRNRRPIGWDEILEGGLPAGAAVMSWRNEENGTLAAQRGHDVVMAPNRHTYFDHYQGSADVEPLAIGGDLPWPKVYGYDPVPKSLPPNQHERILGCQGQLWSEYIPDFARLMYMAYPRACALSEVAWTPPERLDASAFRKRLEHHGVRFAAEGIRAHPL